MYIYSKYIHLVYTCIKYIRYLYIRRRKFGKKIKMYDFIQTLPLALTDSSLNASIILVFIWSVRSWSLLFRVALMAASTVEKSHRGLRGVTTEDIQLTAAIISSRVTGQSWVWRWTQRSILPTMLSGNKKRLSKTQLYSDYTSHSGLKQSLFLFIILKMYYKLIIDNCI